MKLLLVGDSLVQGYPLSSGFRWPLWKAARGFGVQFVGPFVDENNLRHAGYNGAPLQGLAEHLEDLLALRPDVVVLLMGGNGLPNQPAWQVGMLSKKAAEAFVANGAMRVLVSTLPAARHLESEVGAYNREIRKAVASVKGAELLELSAVLGEPSEDNRMYADNAHPSQAGAQALADVLALRLFGMSPSGRIENEPRAHFGASSQGLMRLASDAFQKAYPAVPMSVRHFVLASALVVNNFGQTGVWAPGGVASNNWGKVEYQAHKCPASLVVDGKRYCSFATLEDGARAFYENWASKTMLQAASQLDVAAVADILSLDPKALRDALLEVAGALDEPAVVSRSPLSGGNVLALALGLGIVGATLFHARRAS